MDPAIKREKLMIEQIGLGGLLALWSPAVVMAIAIPYLCGIIVFQSRVVGAAAGLIIGSLVGARAVFWVRKSLAQLRKKRRRDQPPFGEADGG
jgi:hypothetical protein